MTHNNIIVTKDLHFAAYLKYHNVVFLDYSKSGFRFSSDKPETEWRVRHANSCCRGVDSELIHLRKFLR